MLTRQHRMHHNRLVDREQRPVKRPADNMERQRQGLLLAEQQHRLAQLTLKHSLTLSTVALEHRRRPSENVQRYNEINSEQTRSTNSVWTNRSSQLHTLFSLSLLSLLQNYEHKHETWLHFTLTFNSIDKKIEKKTRNWFDRLTFQRLFFCFTAFDGVANLLGNCVRDTVRFLSFVIRFQLISWSKLFFDVIENSRKLRILSFCTPRQLSTLESIWFDNLCCRQTQTDKIRFSFCFFIFFSLLFSFRKIDRMSINVWRYRNSFDWLQLIRQNLVQLLHSLRSVWAVLWPLFTRRCKETEENKIKN